jgi:hypothetical protein
MASCAYHPKREAVGACVSCGQFICAECKTVIGDRIYCNPCANKMFAARTGVGTGTGAPGVENTSGQGSLAVVPAEIGGWNWGAFLLGWIWSIGNSVWIGLLALIPYLGFIMNIILGVKGSEWAWRYKRWNSVEHFKRTQSTWMKWGIGVACGTAVIVIIWFIMFAAMLSSAPPFYW